MRVTYLEIRDQVSGATICLIYRRPRHSVNRALGEQQSWQSISAFRVKENSRSSSRIDPYRRKEVSSYQKVRNFPGLGDIFQLQLVESQGSKNILSIEIRTREIHDRWIDIRKPVFIHPRLRVVFFSASSLFLLSYSFFFPPFFSFLFIDSTRSSTKSISNPFSIVSFFFGVLARWKPRFRLDSIRGKQDCCVATIRTPVSFVDCRDIV